MINTNEIIPVTKIDLLSLLAVALRVADTENTLTIDAGSNGVYTIAETGKHLCDAPVKEIDITAQSATIYFVPAYNYAGIKVNGTAVTPETEINASGADIYVATLADGAVTITCLTA